MVEFLTENKKGMGKLRNLEDLFEYELKDLYSAEYQLTEALPKMASKAHDMQLKQAFENHLDETRTHLDRLKRIGVLLNIDLSGKNCSAMEGLINDNEDMIDEDASAETKDAGLIASAQKIEHYEICGYGTASHFSQKLGHNEVYSLLSESLYEEQRTDTLLNDLAKNYINSKAIA